METSSAAIEIVGVLRRVTSLPLATLLVAMIFTGYCGAQSDVPISQTASASSSSDDPRASNNGKEDDDDENLEQPPPVNLATGGPLSVLVSPFRWGRLSLLAVSAYHGYDSNPFLQATPAATSFTEFYALAVYAVHSARWQLDLQYLPYLSFSPQHTNKSFSAVAMDLQTKRRLSRTWTWSASENLHYSPDRQNAVGSGLGIDSSGGISITNTYLSAGRNVLADNVYLAVNDRYTGHSSLGFHLDGNALRLSSYMGSQSAVNTPVQEAIGFASGLIWTSRLGVRDTITLRYDYRLQSASGTTVGDVEYQTAGISWGHRLGPTLGFSASFGPGWSRYTGAQNATTPQPWRSTLQGSVGMYKSFRRGSVAAAFARSNSFTGVLSNNFNNRYDLILNRRLGTRWSCSATASYVQQQASLAPRTTGEQASGQLNHFFNPNWTIFAQGRYLKVDGSEQFASDMTVALGIRWAWDPEKP